MWSVSLICQNFCLRRKTYILYTFYSFVGCAGCSLLCAGFLWSRRAGAPLPCDGAGFSLQGLCLVKHRLKLWLTGLVAPQHVDGPYIEISTFLGQKNKPQQILNTWNHPVFSDHKVIKLEIKIRKVPEKWATIHIQIVQGSKGSSRILKKFDLMKIIQYKIICGIQLKEEMYSIKFIHYKRWRVKVNQKQWRK